jgi:hypothetical protein
MTLCHCNYTPTSFPATINTRRHIVLGHLARSEHILLAKNETIRILDHAEIQSKTSTRVPGQDRLAAVEAVLLR